MRLPRFRPPKSADRADLRDIVLGTWRAGTTDRVSLAAAGCAFWATTALFPAISALIAIYGLVFDPVAVVRQLGLLSDLLPAPAYVLVHERVIELVEQPRSDLSLRLATGILLAVWSAATGTKAMMSALNVAFDLLETRGILRFQLTGLALTGLAVGGAVLAIAGVVLLPAVLGFVGLSSIGAAAIHAASLLLLVALFACAVALLYRTGPCREATLPLTILPGAVAATVLWLVASAALSYYISHLSSFGATYGSIGAVVGIMLWFYVTAFATLLGAELNARLEMRVVKAPSA